jgi:hypothetical protein
LRPMILGGTLLHLAHLCQFIEESTLTNVQEIEPTQRSRRRRLSSS